MQTAESLYTKPTGRINIGRAVARRSHLDGWNGRLQRNVFKWLQKIEQLHRRTVHTAKASDGEIAGQQ